MKKKNNMGQVEGLSFMELLYADDTALITNNVNTMNRLLAKVEKCATYHGLAFNKAKCINMNFHTNQKQNMPMEPKYQQMNKQHISEPQLAKRAMSGKK